MKRVNISMSEMFSHREQRAHNGRNYQILSFTRLCPFVSFCLPLIFLAQFPAFCPEVEAASESESAVTIITATDTQVVFEITTAKPQLESVVVDGVSYLRITGARSGQPVAGIPDLPREEVILALPPGTEAVARVIDFDLLPLAAGLPLPYPIETLAEPEPGFNRTSLLHSHDQIPHFQREYRPDPGIYQSIESYPPSLASAAPGRHWRAFRIAPIEISPVQYRPETRDLFWYPRLRVQVSFVQTAISAPTKPERSVHLSEPRWEPLYRARILNYDQGRSYKRLPLRSRPLQKQSTAESNFEIKIDIHNTDFYYLTYEELESTDAFSGSLAWNTLRLVVRDYDESAGAEEHSISYLPAENDGDDYFGPGDGIYFYGQDAWDFFAMPPGEKRYLRSNVYWLVNSADPGVQFSQQSGWHDEPDLSYPSTFERTIRYEENNFYSQFCVAGDSVSNDYFSYTKGPQSIKTDHYSWTNPDPIDAGAVQAVQLILPWVNSITSLKVKLQGISKYSSQTHHLARLWLANNDNVSFNSLDPGDTAWAFPGNPYRLGSYQDSLIAIEGDPADSGPLGSGPMNYLKIYLPWVEDGLDEVKEPGMGIDWVEVSCLGLYKMYLHRLQTTETAAGIQEFRITLIKGTDLLAIDITDPRAPGSLVLSQDQFEEAGSKYNLNLQVDFGASPETREFLFIEPDYVTAIGADQLSVRGPALPEFTGQDYISICPDQFASALAPLLEHRASSGHQVLDVSLEELFARYSGGRRHLYAIKYFLRDLWGAAVALPDYLLLIGDGSADIAGYTTVDNGGEAHPNFMPGPTVPGMPTSGRSLVTCDHWYVENLAGAWDATMNGNPDLHLGRVSCGSTDELETYVAKVITYETIDQTNPWRSRVLIHSDDQFSLSGNSLYDRSSGESSFLSISRASIDEIRSDDAFAHYETDSLYQSCLMDTVASLGRCVLDPENSELCLRDSSDEITYTTGVIDQGLNTDYGKTVINEMLINSLNQGVLIWAYQGHSNRRQITDEAVFMHKDNYRDDVHDLTNVNRPFLFIGSGCHLAEYASVIEGSNNLGGDGFVEVMMFATETEYAGSIGCFASSDYERVGHQMERYFFEAMFRTPPGSGEGEEREVRWRMGELTTGAKMLFSDKHQKIFYMLLGDPALRLGIAPPVMDITLNEVSFDPATAGPYVSQRTDDSLHVVVHLLDDSSIPTPVIEDYNGPVSADSIEILQQASSGRHLSFAWNTQIQRRPYTISLSAIDLDGSSREALIEIPFDVAYFEKTADGQIPIAPEAFIQPRSQLVVTISTGVQLSEDDIVLLAGEIPLELASAQQDLVDDLDTWTLTYEALTHLAPTYYNLTLQIMQYDGELFTVSEMPIELGEDNLRFKSVWWIPSPFSTETTLVYDLSLPAERMRLRLFTVSGRCILDQDSDDAESNLRPSLPLTKGIIQYEAPVWNGSDDDGDQVGNGTYFYELTVWDQDGKKADTVLDKLVRVR